MQPTVGRIVHANVPGRDQPLAAIVVHVHAETAGRPALVNLVVYRADGVQYPEIRVPHRDHPLAPTNKAEITTWSWPPMPKVTAAAPKPAKPAKNKNR